MIDQRADADEGVTDAFGVQDAGGASNPAYRAGQRLDVGLDRRAYQFLAGVIVS